MFNPRVVLARTFGVACRRTRIQLDLTQVALGDAVGLSRSYIARIELGQVAVSIDVIERIGEALGMSVDLVIRPPVFLSERVPHDRVHGWCLDAVARRLRDAGWLVAREVEVGEGRTHAWIDLLAFDPRTRTLLIVEIKTRLDDLGALERQLGWYERHAAAAARRLGWAPARVGTWLIGLASDEFERSLLARRSGIDGLFAGRAGHMLAVVRSGAQPVARSVALVDPHSRRADWLIRTRLDGRRSTPPYEGYAAVARLLEARRR